MKRTLKAAECQLSRSESEVQVPISPDIPTVPSPSPSRARFGQTAMTDKSSAMTGAACQTGAILALVHSVIIFIVQMPLRPKRRSTSTTTPADNSRSTSTGMATTTTTTTMTTRPYSRNSTVSIPESCFWTRDFVLGASMVIIQPSSGKVVLVNDTELGTWFLPRGRKDIGETLEQCALREAYEEVRFSRNRNVLFILQKGGGVPCARSERRPWGGREGPVDSSSTRTRACTPPPSLPFSSPFPHKEKEKGITKV
jgi:hypothetical protein